MSTRVTYMTFYQLLKFIFDPLGVLIDGCSTGIDFGFITDAVGVGESVGLKTGRSFDEFFGKSFAVTRIIRIKSSIAKTITSTYILIFLFFKPDFSFAF